VVVGLGLVARFAGADQADVRVGVDEGGRSGLMTVRPVILPPVLL